MKNLRRLFRLSRALLHVGYGVLLLLLFPRLSRQQGLTPWQWRIVNRWMRELCVIIGLRVHYRHLDQFKPELTQLVVANHISWHDIPVLMAVLNARFVSKIEIRAWPVIGWMAAKARTLFIRRGERQAAQAMQMSLRDSLQSHQSVLMFPEGTTGSGECLLPFKYRLLAAAFCEQIPIQTCTIHYAVDGLSIRDISLTLNEPFHYHAWRMLGYRRIETEVIIGPQVHPADLLSVETPDKAELKAGAQALHDMVANQYQSRLTVD